MTVATAFRQWIKRRIHPRHLIWLRCVTRGYPIPRWGNLRRRIPFSTRYGFERGTPIDRYYLEQFLTTERAAIRGRVLEIQASGYTQRFGVGVTIAESLDINSAHNPTYVCDLADAAAVPSNSYDCFLLPNTLHHLRELDAALREALRVVKPGGTILASATGFVPLTPDISDYWHLSVDGWNEVLSRSWRGEELAVEARGNALTAVAALMGIAAEELNREELDRQDGRYPVLITIRCVKRRLTPSP